MWGATGTPDASVRTVVGRVTAFLVSWTAAMAAKGEGTLDRARWRKASSLSAVTTANSGGV